MTGAGREGPSISVIVAAHEMRRELPRTLRSLSPLMQRDVAPDDYELIVVDNGSDPPLEIAESDAFGARIRLLRVDDAPESPVGAINRGLAAARAPLIGVMIDGARIATPGILHHARLAASLHPRPVIATLGFHLGPDVQRRAIKRGYDEEAEDALLESVDWNADGYRLFEISVFSGSSNQGWFVPPEESNALFMPAELWTELGGYDERFTSPGGGLVNTDILIRACRLPGTELVVLLGEGTFHQIHGGVATNRPVAMGDVFREEYRRICGEDPGRPEVEPLFIGAPPPQARASIAASAGGEDRSSRRDAAGRRRYLRLLTKALLGLDAAEAEAAYLAVSDAAERGESLPPGFADDVPAHARRELREVLRARREGGPVRETEPGFAHTLAGRARLNAITRAVSDAVNERVPGDLVQCGVRRGGAGVLMRGALAAWEVTDRAVWVADPFEGHLGADSVTRRFELFDLLDERVRILEGPLGETLPEAPIASIALLYLNVAEPGPAGASLAALYDRMSPGGFLIVDRYFATEECREAVDAFRRGRDIDTPIEQIDASAGSWRVAA